MGTKDGTGGNLNSNCHATGDTFTKGGSSEENIGALQASKVSSWRSTTGNACCKKGENGRGRGHGR